MSTQGSMTIKGIISAILFENAENGYAILKIRCEDRDTLVTVVGYIPGAHPGETISAQGSWGHHATYGEQFNAELVHRELPTTKEGILEYLSSRAIKGIGDTLAGRIVDLFGEKSLEVIEREPKKLLRVQGFTLKRAQAVHQNFVEKTGLRTIFNFLTQNELPQSLAMPLFRQFGVTAPDVIMDNPYVLAEEAFALDFSVVDRLAIRNGVAGDDPQRIEAGLLYELRYNLNNGHSFLPRNKLLLATEQLLHLTGDYLEEGLSALIEQNDIVQDTIAGQEACYLQGIYQAEEFVTFSLLEMARQQQRVPNNLDVIIEKVEKEQNIVFAAHQKEAIEMAAKSQVIIITGGPGTGKSTSMKGVLGLFHALKLKTALAAPTGRAAQRLGELCGADAMTIHRLLETEYDVETGEVSFVHKQSFPLPYDALIVDEISMVDIVLMQALLAGIKADCRLVLVGDPDQLPSVGPGNLLLDMIRSNQIPTIRLTEIFRQAAESGIVRTAHNINRGISPDFSNPYQDFFFMRRYSDLQVAETIADLVVRRLPSKMAIPASQIQVLSPSRLRETGTKYLNQLLQQALNPPDEQKSEKKIGDTTFRLGDRVMQTRINYDLYWEDPATGTGGVGVYYVVMGRIIQADEDCFTVEFDGKLVEYLPEMLPELELAYAITVHKSQGSEYRAVVLAAFNGPARLMNREVLYTAITRAKELCVVVGDTNAVNYMVSNDKQNRRYSGLKFRLMTENE